jgi:nitroimidazol reductase NimA-like FMN-containing flavoprotein (pyridoxamine 5'-phosphate oxidase superfamily)
MDPERLIAVARAIVADNVYMTLATADAEGRPWAAPVWFAADGQADFFWVSTPEARHSLNLRERPELAIVIFDSGVAPGAGQALYLEATASELEGAEAERGIEVFSRASEAAGLPAWTLEDVVDPAAHRLYHATARSAFVLDKDVHGHDERTEVPL